MPLRKPVFTVSTLQQQLREEIYRRIRNQEWKSGEQLPSEIALSDEFGVSVGTVRKVLDDLVHNNVIERRKGRGTYVTTLDKETLEWRFYRLRPPSSRILFSAKQVRLQRRRATGHECAKLKLGDGDQVVSVFRVRELDEVPVLEESIAIPASYVPGMENLDEVPIFLLSYYYEKFGIAMHRSEEMISAELADASLTVTLSIEAGSPILRLERVLFDTTGRPFEWRLRRCTPAAGYYLATVG